MPERIIESEQPLVEPIRAFHLIGNKALIEVLNSFGSGIDLEAILGEDRDFSSALEPNSLYPFHSLVHSMNVGSTSRMIAEELGLPPYLVALAETAGHAHDVIRKGAIGEDEGESAEWFEKYARLYGLSSNYVETGSLAIYGTIPTVRPGDFMLTGQHVSKMAEEDVFEITENPDQAELIARIVASADLGELFQPTGPLMSHMLLFEINKGKPSYEQLLRFQKTQVEMLHAYKHPLGEQTPDILLRHKVDVIRHSEKLLAQLENGEVTTWEEVVTGACEFVRAA